MADEFKVNHNTQYKTTNSNLNLSIAPGSNTFDQAAIGYNDAIISVTTATASTAHPLPAGSVSTPGFLFLRFVTSGTTERVKVLVSDASTSSTGSKVLAELRTGEFNWLRLGTTVSPANVNFLATGGTQKIRTLLFEN